MATASSTARPVTIKLVLVTTPWVWQSKMPRFTPVEAPKSSALTIRYFAPCILFHISNGRQQSLCEANIGQQTRPHLTRFEVFLRDVTSGPAMARVIAVYGVDGRQHFFHRRKGEKSFPNGQALT